MLVLFSCVEMPREWEIRIWFSSVLKLVYWSSLDFLFAEPGWSSGVRSHFSHRGCAAPQFLLSLVSSREWKRICHSQAVSIQRQPWDFPLSWESSLAGSRAPFPSGAQGPCGAVWTRSMTRHHRRFKHQLPRSKWQIRRGEKKMII